MKSQMIGKLLLSAALCLPVLVTAADYPARTVTILVPVPAGGGTDLFARILGQGMAKASGRSVVIDNRVGADGTIAANVVVRAPPDGYTLLYSASSIVNHNTMHPHLAYDVARDLAAVSRPVTIPLVLVVHPSVPAYNVKQLLALAKAKPGALNFGASGAGSQGRLSMELLKFRTNTHMVYVPYRGAGPVTNAVISGEVDIAVLVTPLVLPHIDSGKLRVLAVTSKKRVAVLPKVPTMDEAGVPGFDAIQWHGMFAPANTPEPIIEWLHDEIQRTLRSPQMKARFALDGAEPVEESSQDFARFFRSELEKWREISHWAGIKGD